MNGKALGEGSLRDQVYWNSETRRFHVIHRGRVLDETFDDDRIACALLAQLRCDQLLRDAQGGL